MQNPSAHELMILAIQTINVATLRPLARPGSADPTEMLSIYEMAQRAEPAGLKLRAFQRAGISSRFVAEAIARGVLAVNLPDAVGSG